MLKKKAVLSQVAIVMMVAMLVPLSGGLALGAVVPPTVSTGSYGSVTEYSACVYGSVDKNGGDYITEYGIKYGTSSSNMDKIPVGYSHISGSYSADLSGLQPGTTYYYQAYAWNSAGPSTGGIQTFQTDSLPVATKPSVTTYDPSTYDTTTATIQGYVSSDSALSSFFFKYGTSSSSLNQTCYGYGLNGQNSGTFTGDLTGLQPNTTYYYKACAVNSAGQSEGYTASFKTQALVVANKPAVTTYDPSTYGTTTATIQGYVSSDSALSSSFFKYGTSSSSLNQTCYGYGLNGQNSGTFTGDLTGLQPNTTYYYKAYAVNSAGQSEGYTASFKTQALVVANKPAVTTYDPSTYGTTTATIQGYVSSDSALSSFFFKYGTSSSSLNQTCYGYGLNGQNSGTFTGDLTGLQPNTTYYYKACAVNSAGQSEGYTASFKTQALVVANKPAVTTYDPSTYGTTTATIQGYVSSDSALSSFFFKYGTSSSNLSQTCYGYGLNGQNSGTFTGDLTGLQPNTTYYYKACAVNSAGQSEGYTASFKTQALVVANKPAVTTYDPSTYGTTTATIQGYVSSDSALSSFFFKYGTSSSNLSQTCYGYGLNGQNSGTFTGDLTGLQPNTTYYYKACAVNSAGQSEGYTASLRTEPLSGQYSVTTSSPKAYDASTATLQGYVNSDGALTDFYFKYGTSASNLSKVSYGYGLDGQSTGNFYGDLSGLLPNTTYYYKALASNSTGSIEGSVQSFTTKSAAAAAMEFVSGSVAVEPGTGVVGDTFRFTAGVKGNPAYAYVCFDLGLGKYGSWADKASCKANFKMQEESRSTDGTVTYSFSKALSSSGCSAESFNRYFKVCAVDGSNNEIISEIKSFQVKAVSTPAGTTAIGDIGVNGKVYSTGSIYEGYAGKEFLFTASISGAPSSVVIQFDNGNGSTLMADKMAMSKDGAPASDGSSIYKYKLTVNSPGPASSYKRKVRITAGTVNKEAFFVVRPNEAPAVESISINGTPVTKDDQAFSVGTLKIEAAASGNALAMNLYKMLDKTPEKLIPGQVLGNKLNVSVPFTSSGVYTLRFTAVNSENENIPKDVRIVVGNPKPVISEVDPMSGDPNAGITLTIKGTGFVGYSDKVEVVALTPKDASGTKYSTKNTGDTQIKMLSATATSTTVTLPKGMKDGDYAVWIAKNWSGSESCFEKDGQKLYFKVQSDSKAKITNLSPLSTDLLGTTKMVIDGTGFKGLYSGVDTLTLMAVDPAGTDYSTKNTGQTKISDLQITDTKITATLPAGMKLGDYEVWISKVSAGSKVAVCYEQNGEKVLFKVSLIAVPSIYVYPVARETAQGMAAMAQPLFDIMPLDNVYAGDRLRFRVKLDKGSEGASVNVLLDGQYRIELPYQSSDLVDGQRLYEKTIQINTPGLKSNGYVRDVKIELVKNGKSEFKSTNDYDGKSLNIKVMPDELRPLNTPELKVGDTKTSSIELSWNSVPGATSYVLQRSTDDNFKVNLQTFTIPASTENTVHYSDKSIVVGEVYGYRVLARGDRPDSPFSQVAVAIANETRTVGIFTIRNALKNTSGSPTVNWLTDSFIIDSFKAQKSGQNGWLVDMNVFNRSLQLTEMSCDAVVIIKDKSNKIKGLYPVSGISTPGGTFEELYEGFSLLGQSFTDSYEWGDVREQLGSARLTPLTGLKVEAGDQIIITKTDDMALGLSTYTLVKAIWGMKGNELFTKDDAAEKLMIENMGEEVCKDGVKKLALAYINDGYISLDEIPEVGQLFVDAAIKSAPGEVQKQMLKKFAANALIDLDDIDKKPAATIVKTMTKTLAWRELIMQVARCTGDFQELLKLISDPSLAKEDITITVPEPSLYEN